MRRNISKTSRANSSKKGSSAYERILSETSLKNISLPGFLRNSSPIFLRILDVPPSPRSAPLKPKILQKYSKHSRQDSNWDNFEEFCKFIDDEVTNKVVLRIHGHDITTKELKDLKGSNELSRNIIDCALSVIKKKNREFTQKCEEYPRVLIGKTSFTEKLFSGLSIASRSNVLKYEYVLFPVVKKISGILIWGLICLDNKEVKICFYNPGHIDNSQELFDYVKKFIEYQLNFEGKEISDTYYKHLSCKEIRELEPLKENDSGVFMLIQALSLSTGKNDEILTTMLGEYRIQLLIMLYNYGRM